MAGGRSSAATFTAIVVRPGAPAGPQTAMTSADRRPPVAASPTREGTGTPPRTRVSISAQVRRPIDHLVQAELRRMRSLAVAAGERDDPDPAFVARRRAARR